MSTGVNGKILDVIKSLYKNAKSYVQHADSKSDIFECQVGVRQGDSLSPLLFAIYLNDLNLFLSNRATGLEDISSEISSSLTGDLDIYLKLLLLLYADDTVIFGEDPSSLQNSMDALNDYCKLWKLKINTAKTKIVIFSRGKVRNFPTFYLNNISIEVVYEYKYLGVMFNYNGRFSKAIVQQTRRASKAMFDILKKRSELNLDIETMFKLFDICVLPIAIYGSEVWGFENLQAVERLHLKFCKLLLSLKKSTCSAMVYGETGRFPVSVVVYERMFGFWYRLSHSKMEKLSDLLYLYLVKSHSNNPWLSQMKSLLCTHGLNNVWMTQAKDLDFCYLKPKFQLVLKDTFQQHWFHEVATLTKCDNYRMFKKCFGMEKYLTALPDDFRIAITRFRCRNTKLPVENFYILNLADKKCNQCCLNVIGDEYHYLLECTFFQADRELFVPRYYSRYPARHKLEGLFQLQSPHLIKIAKFIKTICRKLSPAIPTAS